MPKLTSDIQYLDLRYGRILPSQFRWFLSSPQPSLEVVHLARMDGISNIELLAFLSEITTTLSVLNIASCNIPRSQADEEYALDVLMPRLSSLKKINLTGDYISALAIERKGLGQELCQIMVQDAPGVGLQGLTRAMEVAHWKSLKIFKTQKGDKSLVPEILETAKRRGIELDLFYSPRYHKS